MFNLSNIVWTDILQRRNNRSYFMHQTKNSTQSQDIIFLNLLGKQNITEIIYKDNQCWSEMAES